MVVVQVLEKDRQRVLEAVDIALGEKPIAERRVES
jgi:hypothetical protein